MLRKINAKNNWAWKMPKNPPKILNFGKPSREFIKRHTDFGHMCHNGPYSCEIGLDSVKMGRKNKKNVVSTRFK